MDNSIFSLFTEYPKSLDSQENPSKITVEKWVGLRLYNLMGDNKILK